MKAPLVVSNNGKRGTLGCLHLAKSWEVQCSARCDKIELLIALVREVETAADSNDSKILYRTTSKTPVTDINCRLIIHDDEKSPP